MAERYENRLSVFIMRIFQAMDLHQHVPRGLNGYLDVYLTNPSFGLPSNRKSSREKSQAKPTMRHAYSGMSSNRNSDGYGIPLMTVAKEQTHRRASTPMSVTRAHDTDRKMLK